MVDSRGYTPLHVACFYGAANAMVITNALLEADADPRLGDTFGGLAIHVAAGAGHTNLADILVKAPTTLNWPTASKGSTPLFFTAMNGRENTVLHLLRLGAKQPEALDKDTTCPLKVAVQENHHNILRILLDNGMDAVGSAEAVIPSAMGCALCHGRAKILETLLGHFEGDDVTRRHFAQWRVGGVPALHYAVATGRLATVSVLLAAGADERATDNHGRGAHEVIRLEGGIDPAMEAAVFRMLERGPAFRAVSWRWPSNISACFGREGDSNVGLPGRQNVGPLGVKIFRSGNKNALVRLVSRYAK